MVRKSSTTIPIAIWLLKLWTRVRFVVGSGHTALVNLLHAVSFLKCLWLTLSTLLASASSVLLRQKILRKCREDIYHFFNNEKGQIAIYDAVNPLAAGRRSLAKEFAKHDVQVSFGALRNFHQPIDLASNQA
jgi:hypothetical protein